MNTTDKIIKHKTGLLNLAEELVNVSTVVYEIYALGARGTAFELGAALDVGHVLTVRANLNRPRSALTGEFIDRLSGHFPAVE